MKAEGQEFKATLSCVRVCSQPGLLLSDSYLKKKRKEKEIRQETGREGRREGERGREGGREMKAWAC